jgi:hypothetical protein
MHLPVSVNCFVALPKQWHKARLYWETCQKYTITSQLSTGPMAVINQVLKRTAVTKKEARGQGLVARKGGSLQHCPGIKP